MGKHEAQSMRKHKRQGGVPGVDPSVSQNNTSVDGTSASTSLLTSTIVSASASATSSTPSTTLATTTSAPSTLSITSSSSLSSTSTTSSTLSSSASTSTSSSSSSSSTSSLTHAAVTATTSTNGGSTSIISEILTGSSAGAISSSSIASSSSNTSASSNSGGLSSGATTAIAAIAGLAGFAILFWIGVQLLQSKRRQREAAEMEEIDFDPSGNGTSINGDSLHRHNLGFGARPSHSGHSPNGSYAGGHANRDLAEAQWEDEEVWKEREQIYTDYMQSVAPPPGLTTLHASLMRQPTSIGVSAPMVYSDGAGGLSRQPTSAHMYAAAGPDKGNYEQPSLQRQPTIGEYLDVYQQQEGYGGLQRQPTNGAAYGFQPQQHRPYEDAYSGHSPVDVTDPYIAYQLQTGGLSPSPPPAMHQPNQSSRELYRSPAGSGPASGSLEDSYDPFRAAEAVTVGVDIGLGAAIGGAGALARGRSDSVGTAKEEGQGGMRLALVEH